jgi:hypothetical protein
MRVAYALRTLLEQVGGQVVGAPDQYGVYRTGEIPAKHAQAVGADYRVAAVATVGKVALVDFVLGRDADLTDPFDVD